MTTVTKMEVNTTELDALLATMREKEMSGERTLADFRWFLNLTRDGLDELMKDVEEESEQTPPSILRLLVQPLTIAATDGTETISNAKSVFTGYIDLDFREYDANEASQPTLEVSTALYEMAQQDATFKQMFDSLSTDTKKLCMTQSQIIGFVKAHRQHLRMDGYTTLFLFESNKKFFVASVHVNDHGRLEVYVRRFEDGYSWGGGGRRRLVVPQQLRT